MKIWDDFEFAAWSKSHKNKMTETVDLASLQKQESDGRQSGQNEETFCPFRCLTLSFRWRSTQLRSFLLKNDGTKQAKHMSDAKREEAERKQHTSASFSFTSSSWILSESDTSFSYSSRTQKANATKNKMSEVTKKDKRHTKNKKDEHGMSSRNQEL